MSALAIDATDVVPPLSNATATSEGFSDGAKLSASAVAIERGANADVGADLATVAELSDKASILKGRRSAEVQVALRRAEPAPQIQVIERWQGVVVTVDETSFTARLVSTGAVASLPEEEGTFPLELVSPDDHDFVKEGALFTYTIGRELRGGTRRSVSILAFRRTPIWHLRQIHDATKRAEQKAALLGKRFENSERSRVAAAGD